MKTTRMKVLEVFELSDGRTVFAGPIETAELITPASRAHLYVNGVAKLEFRIQGELMPKRLYPSDLRSVTTVEAVTIDRTEVAAGNVDLVLEVQISEHR